jgi:hypothetical protein
MRNKRIQKTKKKFNPKIKIKKFKINETIQKIYFKIIYI